MTAAHAAAQTVRPHDVIVAIVGGTMLTLALTRPRLRWVERLTEDSPSSRLWAERGLTLLAFAMGGYAWACLFLVLHKQLDAEIDTMLKGAASFMILYAWLVHFEPFAAEWRLKGWLGTVVLYTGVATFAASVGVVLADALLISLTLSGLQLLATTSALAGVCWLVYWGLPRIEALLDRAIPRRGRKPKRVSATRASASRPSPRGPRAR